MERGVVCLPWEEGRGGMGKLGAVLGFLGVRSGILLFPPAERGFLLMGAVKIIASLLHHHYQVITDIFLQVYRFGWRPIITSKMKMISHLNIEKTMGYI